MLLQEKLHVPLSVLIFLISDVMYTIPNNSPLLAAEYIDNTLILVSWTTTLSFVAIALMLKFKQQYSIQRNSTQMQFDVQANSAFVICILFSFLAFYIASGANSLWESIDLLLWRVFNKSPKRTCVLLFWLLCCIGSVAFCVAVNTFNHYFHDSTNVATETNDVGALLIIDGSRASTAQRKFFHLTSSLVAVSGLFYEPRLLFLATHIFLQIFIVIETFRSLGICPWAPIFDRWLLIFIDGAQESPRLILTPIFLFVGIFLPVIFNKGGFGITASNLTSAPWKLRQRYFCGVQSVGIGDSFAAIVGSFFAGRGGGSNGRSSHVPPSGGGTPWTRFSQSANTRKSLEGSAAMFLAQMLVMPLILRLIPWLLTPSSLTPSASVEFSWCGLLVSAFVATIMEAHLSIADNVLLPLVTMEGTVHMDAKGKTKNGVRYDDPEMEAEVQYAKKNGNSPPSQPRTLLPPESVMKITEALINGTDIEKVLPKVLKTGKAERKARSRGVSGCSTKKDGGRFEYGLDCIDLAYCNGGVEDDNSSSDSDAEYDEYADYVFQYSDDEIRSIVQDYLLNGSKEEALNSLEKFRITADATFRMLKDLIQLSLEAADGGGVELGSQLIDIIKHDEWVSNRVVLNALEDIVDTLAELTIDSPKIVDAMAVFIAKLINSGILTREVIKLLMVKKAYDSSKNEEINKDERDDNAKANRIANQCYTDALTYADNRALLEGKCVPAGGHQSVEVLSAQFKMILKEFLISNDRDVACSRVNELKVPHFNHEFVFQAGLMALEKMHDIVILRLSELLKHMYDNGLIAVSCIQKGYEKLYDSLSDLFFDLPAAYTLARRWVDKSLASKFISEDIAKKCPVRARSRTVSEGPDGKLFCTEDFDMKNEQNDNKDGANNIAA